MCRCNGALPFLHADARGQWGVLPTSCLLHVLTVVAHSMAPRCHRLPMASAIFYLQLSAMDVSVRTTMKGAAKCDKHCELQNSVNRQGLERILCFWDIPESMPASVSMLSCSSSSATPGTAAASACASRCILVVLLRHSTDKASVRLPAY